MFLTHGGSAGASVELLILGLAMAVLGVVFFVQKTTKPIVPVLLVLGGIALGIGGFVSAQGADEHEDEHPAAAVVDYQETVDALCEERAAASTGGDDLGDAFFDRAHAGIHEIATRVEAEDRAAAARLLEAKGAFESDLRGEDVGRSSPLPGEVDIREKAKNRQLPPSLQDLESDLDELIDATIAALSVLGEEVTSCS